ncbi:coiled-coil domain-containing protein, partial [Fusobacterium necrogenes]|uniref:coiled-coil domain-containing protein n=1 Tax=Fusobacterium necrogenes TaxID=858 RepID=UPI00255CD3AE
PIPGVVNSPAEAPKTTTVEAPAPIPDVPRPEGAKVVIPEAGNSKKKVSFADDVEVTLVPEKDPSRTSVDEATGDVDAIAGSMDKLLTEQQALTDKLNSGKKLSKKEQERLDAIEKELNNLNDQLKDAIGRENVDREDSERIPEEMNDLLREKEALTDKVKNGEELTADEKDRLDEINLDLDTLQNTMVNSKLTKDEYLASPAPAPVTVKVPGPEQLPDVPRPEGAKVPIPGAGGEDRPPLPPVDYNQGDDRPTSRL